MQKNFLFLSEIESKLIYRKKKICIEILWKMLVNTCKDNVDSDFRGKIDTLLWAFVNLGSETHNKT